MRRIRAVVAVALTFSLAAVTVFAKCPPDSAEVGPTCVDKYEASIWQIPPGNTSLLARVKKGKATEADLLAGGATQLGAAQATEGCTSLEYPDTFRYNGNWTQPLYALSLPNVMPSACVSWFQAEQACALSGKRLITNQEFQRAVAGTPDPNADNGVTDCNTGSVFAPLPTGSRVGCLSNWGVYDMVGNLSEMTGDWDERAVACSYQTLDLGGDSVCFGGAGDGTIGSVIRGGQWFFGIPNGGAFFLSAALDPASYFGHIGFRCAR